MITDAEDFKNPRSPRSPSPDPPQDLVDIRGWKPINGLEYDMAHTTTQHTVSTQQGPAAPTPVSSNACLLRTAQGCVWRAHTFMPDDDTIFRLPLSQITGDRLVHLSTRYSVGEITYEVSQYHPESTLDAPAFSNRLQRAVRNLGKREGFTTKQVRAAIQRVAQSNGLLVNGKRMANRPDDGYAGRGSLPYYNDAEDDDESEIEDDEPADEQEIPENTHVPHNTSVPKDNGAPSVMIQKWLEAKEASEEEETSGSEEVEPLNIAPVNEGTFRVFN